MYSIKIMKSIKNLYNKVLIVIWRNNKFKMKNNNLNKRILNKKIRQLNYQMLSLIKKYIIKKNTQLWIKYLSKI